MEWKEQLSWRNLGGLKIGRHSECLLCPLSRCSSSPPVVVYVAIACSHNDEWLDVCLCVCVCVLCVHVRTLAVHHIYTQSNARTHNDVIYTITQ